MKYTPADKNVKVDHHPHHHPHHQQHQQQPKMVERAPSYVYHMTYEAVPPVGLLSSTGPFLTADVTNPRELYSILSETSKQKQDRPAAAMAAAVVAGSVSAGGSYAQPTVKLPPLQSSTSSSEMQSFRTLREQTQYSSYPDLASLSRQLGPVSSSRLDSVRRSTSLQDVRSLDKADGMLTSKKLTPIPRESKTPRSALDQQEKAGVVRSGKTATEGHSDLLRDRLLPPIDRKADAADNNNNNNAGSLTLTARFQSGDDYDYGHGPPLSHRRLLECQRFIFPRGQLVQVKKPLTPTYDDYPEAYWELRSPTVQDPSDLKEDMIDRDYYRLQQISMHHLRAVNRDVVSSKLDPYRKWQQSMHEHCLPPLALSNKLESYRSADAVWPSAPAAAAANGGPLMSDRPWSKHKMSLTVPVQNLILAAKTIGPSSSPAVKKQNDAAKSTEMEPAGHAKVQDEAADAGAEQQQEQPKRSDGEHGAQQHEEKPVKTNKTEKDTGKHEEAKPLKASVVNLQMDPAPSKSQIATPDIQPGLRKAAAHNARPPAAHADRVMGPHHPAKEQQPDQRHPHNNQAAPVPARRQSTASMEGTASSSLSLYLHQRLPSAPAATPPPTLRPAHPTTNGRGGERVKTATETTSRKNNGDAGGKLILKKFNRLQVFGEKSSSDNAAVGSSQAPCYSLDMNTAKKRKPYLPQNRPPTYRLDMRNYPPRRAGESDHGHEHAAGEHEPGIRMVGGGYPILISERRGIVHQSSEKVDPASLSFRFRDGEVIVSRQGKRTFVCF